MKIIHLRQTLPTLLFTCCVSVFLVFDAVAAPEFTRSEGVVFDSTTNLQWQDDYQDNGGETRSGSQQEAKLYCEGLGLADHADWRLPSREELLSIVDKKKKDPAIVGAFTQTEVDEAYLTNTQYEDDDETVWIVDFFEGDSVDVALVFSDGYRVRCVRAN